MQLSEEQAQVCRRWLEEGVKLSDFQKRMEAEWGIQLTYMEVRLLVDDLKVTLRDPEPEPEPAKAGSPQDDTGLPGETLEPDEVLPPGSGGVSVSMDTVTQPGTMASGKVTFSDGQGARWYIDTMGRPGLVPDQKGYRPTPADIEQFQIALERELMRRGY